MAKPIELPPMIADKVHDPRKNRVRVELSVSRAEWLLSLIETSMTSIAVDDPEFHESYSVFLSLDAQLQKLRKS